MHLTKSVIISFVSFLLIFFASAIIFARSFFFWKDQEYEAIGSMLSGLFGSAAAIAGSIVAIVLAIKALQLSKEQSSLQKKQALLEDEKIIDSFILEKINPALRILSDLIVLTRHLHVLVLFIKNKNGDENYKQILIDEFISRTDEIRRCFINLKTDKLALTFCEKKF